MSRVSKQIVWLLLLQFGTKTLTSQKRRSSGSLFTCRPLLWSTWCWMQPVFKKIPLPILFFATMKLPRSDSLSPSFQICSKQLWTLQSAIEKRQDLLLLCFPAACFEFMSLSKEGTVQTVSAGAQHQVLQRPTMRSKEHLSKIIATYNHGVKLVLLIKLVGQLLVECRKGGFSNMKYLLYCSMSLTASGRLILRFLRYQWFQRQPSALKHTPLALWEADFSWVLGERERILVHPCTSCTGYWFTSMWCSIVIQQVPQCRPYMYVVFIVPTMQVNMREHIFFRLTSIFISFRACKNSEPPQNYRKHNPQRTWKSMTWPLRPASDISHHAYGTEKLHLFMLSVMRFCQPQKYICSKDEVPSNARRSLLLDSALSK